MDYKVLRGGEEHRSLKLSQFECLQDPDCYVYHENCSKKTDQEHSVSFMWSVKLYLSTVHVTMKQFTTSLH